jgi:hypothetical protein
MSFEGLGDEEVTSRFADIVEPYCVEYTQPALLANRVLRAYKSLHEAAHKTSFAAHGNNEVLTIHRHAYDFGRHVDHVGRTPDGNLFVLLPGVEDSSDPMRFEVDLANKNNHADSVAQLVVIAATLEDDLEAFGQHAAHLYVQ